MTVKINGKGIQHWLIFLHNHHGLIPNFSKVYGTNVMTVSQEEGRSLTLGLSIEKVNATYLPGDEEDACSETHKEIDIENCLDTTVKSHVGCR